ncbi:MAG: SPFH domain-containing protein [Candidatus Thorarchaeota archaeon]|nr:SPFH domain-containing protein [Candidatus Thorarchaeota archaeon]
MGTEEQHDNTYEYSGSPAPFVTFLILFILTIAIPILKLPITFLPEPVVWILALVFLLMIPLTIAINKQWEEAIILRFGRYKRLVGAGIFFKWPFVEKFLRIDRRIQTIDVSRQEVMTKDNISLVADAVVFMKVVKTADALMNIQDIKTSVISYAQTTMRDVIGNVELDDLLAKRDEIANAIEEIVDKETAEWGIDIISVNLQNIEIPEDMKRVIARQAEAERERRAVIIKSEGELRAAENLEAAVKKMSTKALYLRTLSSLEDISFDQSNTIVFAIPMDMTRGEIIGLTGLAGGTTKKKQIAAPPEKRPEESKNEDEERSTNTTE